ncbi:MAG: SAM-dependent methyltransferase [Myxococcota bacterium]
MSLKGPALTRLRRTLRRHAKDGWVRAVFATPGSDEGAAVHPGPDGGGPPSDAQLEALLVAAEQAAREGKVKQTLVLDDSTRVRVDARFGKAKVQRLDEGRIAKVMGGKERALRPDTSGELLRVIGIMNADGSISAKNAKKYKQVCHLVELCRPAWERVASQRTVDADHPLRVVDLGCGNSYLTFVVAEALRLAEIPARLHGVDVRADVIERSRERATALSMSNMSFAVASIGDAVLDHDGPPDLVLALHACDTATDEALAQAITAGAGEIFVAPCCQRELASQLSASPVRAMLRQGLLKQDYAATLTDALRVELLEACGYIVDTVEFVASAHTPKNLLIRAHRRHPGTPIDRQRWRLDRVSETCTALGVDPTALRLLRAA